MRDEAEARVEWVHGTCAQAPDWRNMLHWDASVHRKCTILEGREGSLEGCR